MTEQEYRTNLEELLRQEFAASYLYEQGELEVSDLDARITATQQYYEEGSQALGADVALNVLLDVETKLVMEQEF